jgi:histidine ammonia-lyase
MIAHVTAAALASENKTLAHPASVDSIPTSANKEDHVSMGVTAAAKAARAVANTRRILAIEAIAGCQALEFLKPLETSPALSAAYARVRRTVPAYDTDRILSPEIDAVAAVVSEGTLALDAGAVCGTLE